MDSVLAIGNVGGVNNEGSNMSKQKGTRNEKKVVDWFGDHGWYAQRTGGSGAGTADARPDVVAMRPNEYGRSDVVVAEVKGRDDGTVRFGKEDEHDELLQVANQSGALALFITSPDQRLSQHEHMYAFKSEDLKENAKSYSVTGKMVEDAPSIGEVIESVFG